MLNLPLCLTLRHPLDCSPPGSSVHGILQARILEWVAIPFSRDLPYPEIEPESIASPSLEAGSLPLSHWGSPINGSDWGKLGLALVGRSCSVKL